jgi:hypothetical protein
LQHFLGPYCILGNTQLPIYRLGRSWLYTSSKGMYRNRVLSLHVYALALLPTKRSLRHEGKGMSIDQHLLLLHGCIVDLVDVSFSYKSTRRSKESCRPSGDFIHPPSLQLVRCRGVPLYPVLITRRSLTSTQPTLLFMQLLLCAASEASCMKYWSQFGRRRCSSARFRASRAACSSSKEEQELNNRTCARSVR